MSKESIEKKVRSASAGNGHASSLNSPVLALDLFLPYRLLVVTHQVSRVFEHRYKKDFNITIAESRVINALGLASPLSSWEIGERTEMTKTRVSVAINSLDKAGLLNKKADPNDHRQLQVSLTRKGDVLRAKIAVVALELEQQLIASCGPAGRLQLMRLLDDVGKDASGLRS